MIADSIKMTGSLNIELFDGDNILIAKRVVDNLIVTSGKTFMASRMKDATAAAMTHMAVGTSATTAAVGDTQLLVQLSNRVALDSTVVSSNVITYTCTFLPTVCTGAIVEAGIFNAATSGTMLARTTFGTVTKNAADTLVITWTVTIA